MTTPPTTIDDRVTRAVLAAAAAMLTALQLWLFVWTSAFNQTWRSAIDGYFAWAAVPTTIVCAVAAILSFRQTTLRWTLFWAITGVVVAAAVVFGGLFYEEWLETQPGGRGYNPAH